MLFVDNDYIVKIRRQLHQYPEVDFDLPRTVALVKSELESMGITPTEKYGKGSVVGYINPEKEGFTIGIRADMDALRVQEVNDVPYRSKLDGFMHACGHDAHTAILLATAKCLKGMEKDIACRVKLLFQPSEEGVESGAAMMIENGVLEDVDVIIGLHVECVQDCGTLGVCIGDSMASSRNFKIEIFGKSAHGAAPHTGSDALAVAVQIYNNIQTMLNRQFHPMYTYLCNIGKLEAGTAQNVVADYAIMQGTIRAFNMKVDNKIITNIERIARNAAEEYGARAEVTAPLKSVVLYNDPQISHLVLKAMEKVVDKEHIVQIGKRLGAEDFSRYVEKVPGVLFRLGTRNKEKGIAAITHNNDFDVDEDGLHLGARTFVQFVLDNMHGIDMQEG